MNLVTVIPALNEASTIGEVVSGARGLCSRVVVIDDGSSDGTSDVARLSGAVVHRRECTEGYTSCILEGFRIALDSGADLIATMDGDAAHSPDELGALTKQHISRAATLTIGDRFQIPSSSVASTKVLGNRVVANLLSLASPVPLSKTDVASGFRIFSAGFARDLIRTTGAIPGFGWCYFSILTAAAMGRRVEYCPVSVRYDGSRLLFTRVFEFLDMIKTLQMFCLPGELGSRISELYTAVESNRLIRFDFGNDIIYAVPLADIHGYIFQEQHKFFVTAQKECDSSFNFHGYA